MRIALVAGETSGDMLGAGLIRALREKYPQATFEGIGGPLMQAEGFHSKVPMERLAVMGLVEVLGRLPELLLLRRRLIKDWQASPPDVFVGIDAPDFNIELENKLKQSGIKTVHYCSPSVWAWRENRVFKIAKAVDLMLTLFPFEADFYQRHQVPVQFVGHHLADSIASEPDTSSARQSLGIDGNGPLVCLMPGSRSSEVSRLLPVFFAAAEQILLKRHDVQFVLPAANEERRQQIEGQLAQLKRPLPIRVVVNRSHVCMEAATAVLLASGTATLEAMLLKKPMVVSYIVAPMTYRILKRLVKQPYIALPNLLANREVVPEFIQDDATADNLADAILARLDTTQEMQQLNLTFREIHDSLRCDANMKAATAIADLIST